MGCKLAKSDFRLNKSGNHDLVEGAITHDTGISNKSKLQVDLSAYAAFSLKLIGYGTDEELKFILLKEELLVIVGKHTAVN